MKLNDLKKLMAEAIHQESLSGAPDDVVAVTTEEDDMSEDVMTDDLGTDLATDTWGDAAAAFSEAVQDVLQGSAKKIVQIFDQRFGDEGQIPARFEDLTGVADDIVDSAVQNTDFKETLHAIVVHALKKRM
jgi:hypothetical protein